MLLSTKWHPSLFYLKAASYSPKLFRYVKIKETLPIIKSCRVAICNDSSFSHLSAALGIPTIVLLSDTPLMYGNYSPKMYPITPDGEKTVTHDTLGKERINPEKIFKIFKEIIN